jgi:hypothetical protein
MEDVQKARFQVFKRRVREMAFPPNLVDFLHNKGELYAAKQYPIHDIIRIPSLASALAKADSRVQVMKDGVLNERYLEVFLSLSGFSHIQEWVEAIKDQYTRRKHPIRNLWIVHVVLLGGLQPSEWESGLLDLLNRDEDEHLEFKSSFAWDYVRAVRSKDIEFGILKTISAFMNSSGGILAVGVDDRRKVLGLERDFSLLGKSDRDGLELKITGLIDGYLGIENRDLVHISWQELLGKTVAIIRVDRSNRPVYMESGGKSEFYVRAGNSSQPLDLREATEYIRDHWKL